MKVTKAGVSSVSVDLSADCLRTTTGAAPKRIGIPEDLIGDTDRATEAKAAPWAGGAA